MSNRKRILDLLIQMGKEENPDVEEGKKIEKKEHNLSDSLSTKIAEDHLNEDPDAYKEEEETEEEDAMCEECGKEMEECDCNPLRQLMNKHKRFNPGEVEMINEPRPKSQSPITRFIKPKGKK